MPRKIAPSTPKAQELAQWLRGQRDVANGEELSQRVGPALHRTGAPRGAGARTSGDPRPGAVRAPRGPMWVSQWL